MIELCRDINYSPQKMMYFSDTDFLPDFLFFTDFYTNFLPFTDFFTDFSRIALQGPTEGKLQISKKSVWKSVCFGR